MRHTLQIDTPADGFADCYLLGNGALGAAVHGRTGTERVDLNLDTLWSGGPAAPRVWCDPGDVAPLRAAVAAGDHRRADELARALQSDRWVQAFQPLGWIEWEHDRAQSGKNSAAYRRSLDMSAAVAVTDAGTGVRLEIFVSAVDDCSSPAPTARRPPRRCCAARTPCARRRPHSPVSRG